MKTLETPKIYVGTYAKYNNGSLFGEWVDLSIYDTEEDFINYCKQLHDDENAAEFMYQDYENIPKKLIAESSLNDKLFDYVKAIRDLEDETITGLGYFLSEKTIKSDTDFDELIEQFHDEYQGYFDGDEGAELEFTYHYIDENGILDEMPKHLQSYFDYKAYAFDLFIDDFIEHDGHVFRRG